MADAGNLEAASAGLAAALRERSMDGHLRLDDYVDDPAPEGRA